MPSRLTWDTSGIERITKRRVARGLGRISRNVRRIAHQSVSKKAPPSSQPGEPPRTATGTLRDGIVTESKDNGLTREIGLTAKAWYGLLLERGTSRVRARPFLLPALRQATKGIKGRIFTEDD